MASHAGELMGLIKKPQKLILDDNKRVVEVHDRGESFRLQKERQLQQSGITDELSTHINESIGNDDLIDAIAEELDMAKVSNVFEPEKGFIPQSQFARILTFERVRRIVFFLPCLKKEQNKDLLAQEIYYGDASKSPAVKLLAVLIGIERTQDFYKIMSDGVRDSCLPLHRGAYDEKHFLRCRVHGEHHTINEYRRPETRQRFATWSYTLNSPFFDWGSQRHSHYLFNTGDVLPFVASHRVQEDVSTSDAAETAATSDRDNAYGGFSEVHKIKIHESHRDFGDHGIRHPQGFFALKKLTSNSRDSFNLELSSLLFTGEKYTKKHLIQLLATFEVINQAANKPTFYFLFDWAEGSLNKFWQSNQSLVRDRRHCIWMATQFYELSYALQCVHNDRAPTLRYLEDRDSNEALYGRHGDIKPGNFLWFRGSNGFPGLLALSDFGLGRLHTQVSRSKQDPNIERSASYRSPEFDLPFGKLSPRSDIFSLGCVFLEYVTWFLLGFGAVENDFPEYRMDKDIYGFDSDTFFKIGDSGPKIKPSVVKWIEDLQDHQECSWYLWQLLDLIKTRMLDPNSATRISSHQLTKEMKALYKTCTDDPSFYLGLRSTSRRHEQHREGGNSLEAAESDVLNPGKPSQTVRSDNTNPIPNHVKERGMLVSQTADILCLAVPTIQDEVALRRVLPDLPNFIEEFIFRLAAEASASQVRAFTDLIQQSQSLLVERLQHHIVGDQPLPKKGIDTRSHRQVLPARHTTFPQNIEREDSSHDQQSTVSLQVRDLITNGVASRWLMSRIRNASILETPGNKSNKERLRRKIIRSITRTIGSNLGPPHYQADFEVEWDPIAFYREQEYEESLELALEGAITLTGFGNEVQALTCLQYLSQTWPTTGPQFLGLIQRAVTEPEASHTATLSDKATVTVTYVTDRLKLSVSGNAYFIAEIGEQIAWMGSALRSSDLPQGVAYCEPSISTVEDHNRGGTAPVLFILGFSLEPYRDQTTRDATCWQHLFRNPVVVRGFPVPSRSKPNSGLDIPLDIMARMINATNVVDFSGRTFMKGFSAMLVATEVSPTTVFWHLFYNDNGEHISYTDSRIARVCGEPVVVDISQLEGSRHIVGWCGDVKNFAGSPDANYNLEWSGLTAPTSDCALHNVSISAGKFVNAGANVALGLREKPLHIQAVLDDYIGNLMILRKRHFVFYDVDDQRAWLVDGVSTLLHLLRVALEEYKQDQNLRQSSRIVFDGNELQEAEQSHRGGDAAFEFLANEDNLSVPIYHRVTENWTEKTTKLGSPDSEEVLKEKRTFFRLKDRICQIIDVLERVIARQGSTDTQNGVSLRVSPRRKLVGFDFMDIATATDEFNPRMTRLSQTGRGWVDFTRAIHTVTLFGKGFGEIFQPAKRDKECRLCLWNSHVPKGEDHLAVCVADLRPIIRRRGDILHRPWRLVDDIHWHTPDKAFEPCTCSKYMSRRHDRVQVLMPKSCTGRWEAKSPETLPDGAVIFGHSRKFSLLWGSEGEPKRNDRSWGDANSDSAMDSGIGTSNSGSSPRALTQTWSLGPSSSQSMGIARAQKRYGFGMYLHANGPIIPNNTEDSRIIWEYSKKPASLATENR